MAIRDIFVFVAVFGLLPFCVARPYIGILTWAWVGYMNPHKLSWGYAFDFPFAQLVAAATLLGVITLPFRGSGIPKMPWERESILLIVLWAMFLISTLFALLPDEAWPEFEKLSKILLATFLTLVLIDDERKMKYLLIVIAFSIGFYGFTGGLWSVGSGGQHRVYGPGGLISGNNAIGLALNMVLPIIYFFSRMESNAWIRRLLLLTFVLSVVAVMFTYSRGAILGLVAVLGLIAMTFKFKAKVALALVLVLSLPIAISFVPDGWIDRMATLKTYEEDGSAMARLGAWRTAWLIGVNRPLVGGGFQIVDDVAVAGSFNPEFTTANVGVHSVFFEVLGENGFVAFGIFMLLLLLCLSSLRKIQRATENTDLDRFYYYAKMLEIGLVGYAVTGLFLEMASFDLFYHFVAITVILKRVLRRALEEAESGSNIAHSGVAGIVPANASGRRAGLQNRVRFKSQIESRTERR